MTDQNNCHNCRHSEKDLKYSLKFRDGDQVTYEYRYLCTKYDYITVFGGALYECEGWEKKRKEG